MKSRCAEDGRAARGKEPGALGFYGVTEPNLEELPPDFLFYELIQ